MAHNDNMKLSYRTAANEDLNEIRYAENANRALEDALVDACLEHAQRLRTRFETRLRAYFRGASHCGIGIHLIRNVARSGSDVGRVRRSSHHDLDRESVA